MKKTTKNVLIGGGVVTAGLAAFSAFRHFTTKYLMKLALNREGPKRTNRDKEKLMSSDGLSEIVEAVTQAASELEASEHETVEITARDGNLLVGHWYGSENAERVIVAMHGWRSGWSRDFGAIAPFWFGNNCAVLFAEQRGQGSSGGDYMGFGLLERYDCLDWINWVNEKLGASMPIYLAGISMGASTVLMTAGFELPENVNGIMADCGFTSPHAIWKHVVENSFKLPFGLYSRAARDICEKRIQVPSDSYSTVEAMKNCKVPVLFIHGTEDNFVPVEMTYENYKACAAEKKLYVVPGAEHATSYLADKDGYENAVKEFWARYDGLPMKTDF